MEKMTYVALDVHPNKIVARWRKVDTAVEGLETDESAEGLRILRKKVGKGKVWVVYEASSCGFALHDKLSGFGWKVSVVAPTHVDRSVRGKKRKTDAEDAAHLLDLLLAHGELGTRLPEVWIPPVKTREDRELVRRRLEVGEKIGTIKTRIRSFLRMHDVTGPLDGKRNWTRKHLGWLVSLCGKESVLCGSLKVSLASRLRELEALTQEKKILDKALKELAKEPTYQKQMAAVTQIPGVGRVVGLTFLLELGEMRRFRNRKQLGSYLGLTPMTFESGQAEDRKGHITRMGPSRLRKVLNQAAWMHLKGNPEARRWYQGVRKRRGVKRAIVGLMRHLGILMWHRASEAA